MSKTVVAVCGAPDPGKSLFHSLLTQMSVGTNKYPTAPPTIHTQSFSPMLPSQRELAGMMIERMAGERRVVAVE